MKKLEFRLLRADEIDCRIATVKGNGLSLLLYKDARVDQNILDETVGPMNWQRRHCRENANCIVSIWDTEKELWIEKEDTGTESYTEKEKGLASDSFKRACFNWGIGRELYTAPFIWINAADCAIKESNDQRGNKKYTCYDKFIVSKIEYDENRNINNLVIKHSRTNKAVYKIGNREEPEGTPEQENKNAVEGLTDAQYNTIIKCLKQNQMTQKQVMERFSIKNIRKLSMAQFRELMDEFNPPAATSEDMKKDMPPDNMSEQLFQ